MERNKRMKKIKAGKYGYYFSNNVHANEYEWINASIENNRNTCKIKTVNSSLTNCREMVIKLGIFPRNHEAVAPNKKRTSYTKSKLYALVKENI